MLKINCILKILELNILIIFTLILTLVFTGKIHSQSDSGRIREDTLTTVKTNDKEKKKKKEKEKGFIIYSDSGKSSLKVYGEVRLNGALDLNGLQAEETFNVYEIQVDVPTSYEKRFYLGVFQSRIGLDAKINTPAGIMNAKIEGDFNGSNNTFRIRQSFAKINSFLGGKTRSLFGDADAMPTKVDRDGPNFAMSERTIQLRFEPKIENGIKWGVALENPEADITGPTNVSVDPYYQSIPPLVSFLQSDFDDGSHLRLSGIFRNITVRNTNQQLQILQGYGALFSGKVALNLKNTINFQVFGGQSIARYVKSYKGEGEDVVFDTLNNVYEPVNCIGGFVSLSHIWGEKLTSDFTYGLSQLEEIQSQPGTTLNLGYYGSVNLFYRSFSSSEVGIEYSFGKKVAINEQSGTANRISFIMFFYI